MCAKGLLVSGKHIKLLYRAKTADRSYCWVESSMQLEDAYVLSVTRCVAAVRIATSLSGRPSD